MKRGCLLTLVLLLSSFIITSSAMAVSVFGPKQYVQTTGDTNVYTDTFPAILGEGKLIVRNGNLDGSRKITDAISSGVVILNGKGMFGTSDFNQNVYLLEAVVNLGEANAIQVELNSNPGSYITIEVTEEVDPPTVTISALPDTIMLGGSAILTWKSINADTCTIEPGIGPVDPSGSVSVSPTQTTTHTITAMGPGGTATAQTVVTVTAAGPEPQPEGSFGDQYEDLIPSDATAALYDPKRFSVVTGLVQDMASSPIADVAVTVHSHSEYGTATTDTGGRFSIPVEGGDTMTVV